MKLSKFLSSNQGVTSIEFALLFIPFFLMISVIIETLIITYQISLLDYMVDKAAKQASTFKGNVKENFQELIDQDENGFLRFILDKENLKADVSFCKNLQELKANECSTDEDGSALGIYELSYKINPIFLATRAVLGDENINSKAVFFIEGTKEISR